MGSVWSGQRYGYQTAKAENSLVVFRPKYAQISMARRIGQLEHCVVVRFSFFAAFYSCAETDREEEENATRHPHCP